MVDGRRWRFSLNGWVDLFRVLDRVFLDPTIESMFWFLEKVSCVHTRLSRHSLSGVPESNWRGLVQASFLVTSDAGILPLQE